MAYANRNPPPRKTQPPSFNPPPLPPRFHESDLITSPDARTPPPLPPRRYSGAPIYEDLDTARQAPPPDPRQKPKEEAKNKFLGTNKVQPLNAQNYMDHVSQFEKTLVMFYNPFQCESVFPGLEFAGASSKTVKRAYSFASVDCSKEKGLCLQEQVLKPPVFKLYSNGHHVSTIRDVLNFKADQMVMLVAMTPVLKHPRKDFAESYRARS